MDRLVYLGMAGAKQALEQQAVIAHNIANVGTTGFRAQINHFRAVHVVGEEITTRSQVLASTPGADLRPGPLERTRRNLDVAIDGEGWLAVRQPDGRDGYTRAGSLQLDADGQIRLPGGAAVMGEAGPMAAPPGTPLSVAQDGTISASDAHGSNAIGRLKLVNPAPGELLRGDDGFFYAAQGVPEPMRAEQVRVQSGMLEGSNVNAAEALVAMIANARHFEMQMKTVQTAEQNEQQANKLLSLG
jgi:flagellar basal-body rod protein FlgF